MGFGGHWACKGDKGGIPGVWEMFEGCSQRYSRCVLVFERCGRSLRGGGGI